MADSMQGTWQRLAEFMKGSIEAEQVFCSLVTEMGYQPQFRGNSALAIVHRENYETSYHRNTAAGNLERLLQGDTSNEMLVLLTVECFIEARQHDGTAEMALMQIKAVSQEDSGWLEAARFWHQKRRQYLDSATEVLYTSIGPAMWEKGVALVE